MIKECPICGRLFTAKRVDAVYCSPTCRSRKHRAPDMDVDALRTACTPAGLIDRAHAVASDMSRAAMVSPMPTAASLGRIAGAIEDALRSEGL